LLAALGRRQTGSGISARLFLAAIATKPSHFGSRDGDLKIAVARNLPFQIFVEFTFKLTNPSAANTCHVDVVPRAVAFVEVAMAAQVKQVEFIDQAVLFEKFERAVNGNPGNIRIHLLRKFEDFAGVQVLSRAFHYLQHHPTLASQANTASAQLTLQTARRLVLVNAFAR
jgi:hypothetical protein